MGYHITFRNYMLRVIVKRSHPQIRDYIICCSIMFHATYLIDAFASRPSSVAALSVSSYQQRLLCNNNERNYLSPRHHHYLDVPKLSSLQSSNSDNNINSPTMKETSSSDNNKATTTVVGSTEYYQGFITRSMNEEPTERVTGDAILGPTLKFAGGISLLLILFMGVFLVSNGII